MDRSLAQKGIIELVNRFETHFDSYKDQNYKEARLRGEFINPFFEYLGWDVYNKNNAAEAYREVIQEDSLKIEDTLKAPDYSFRLAGGKRLFFVEAKKPSVSVIESIQPAYQVRRYGWSAKHPISVVTDFEEFAIYDCATKPNPNDKPSVARIKYLTYQDYLREFDFIWNTFSREQVLRGSFDKFVHSDKQKQGTATVDKDFLESLDRWRTYLAVSLSWKNKLLGEDEINFAVQQLIDRIIFLRIAEDRKIEPYGSLKSVLSYGDYYTSLFSLFRRADEKYNSGLFDFKRDRISETLKVDNKVLKTIIEELYYPKCPYEFSVLPIEILGSVYEQFLGKIIRITPAHHAKVEEKPEVRKAGGVYYTPQYVVDYIVRNTVGKLIEGKAPNDISSIKIVDPACGSGSFLIGALHYLFEYHRNFYNHNNYSRYKKNSPLTPDGHLSVSEKKRILLNNIYGVDLDANAVEVTKLSLLLKCLEGETDESINQQLRLFNERVLPSLDNNIKDGNSLIDTDYYDNQLDFGEERRIKPFNWQKAFHEVFKQGGFDAVIGNPPYLKERGNKEVFEPVLRSRIGQLYHQGKMDFWYYFVHRGIDIAKEGGYLAFITNSYWMHSDGSSKLIERIRDNMTVITIVDFSNFKVFQNVSGKHNIAIFKKTVSKNFGTLILRIDQTNPSSDISSFKQEVIQNDHLFNKYGKISISSNTDLFKDCELLGEHFDTSTGVQESTDKVTKLHKEKFRNSLVNIGEGVFVLNQTEISNLNLTEEEKKILKPYVNTNHVKKYGIDFQNEYLLYIGKGESLKIARNDYPNLKKHLDRMQQFITSSNAPYGLHRPRNPRFFEEPKIICKGMFKAPEFYYDDEGYYCGFSFSVIVQKTNIYPLKLLLAIMNSRVGEYWFNLNGKKRGIGVDIGGKVFRLFPLPKINTKEEGDILENAIGLVDNLLAMNRKIRDLNLETQRQQISGKIDYYETKINQIVYQLYGLTEEEIAIVENSVRN